MSNHYSIGYALTTLAYVYLQQERLEEAETLMLRVQASGKRALGKKHLHLVSGLTLLASVYQKRQKYEQAEQRYRQALALLEQAQAWERYSLPNIRSGLSQLAALAP